MPSAMTLMEVITAHALLAMKEMEHIVKVRAEYKCIIPYIVMINIIADNTT